MFSWLRRHANRKREDYMAEDESLDEQMLYGLTRGDLGGAAIV